VFLYMHDDIIKFLIDFFDQIMFELNVREIFVHRLIFVQPI
jgi:hypothetical protein